MSPTSSSNENDSAGVTPDPQLVAPNIPQTPEKQSFFGSRTVLKSPKDALQPDVPPPPPPRPKKRKRRRSGLSRLSAFATFLMIAAVLSLAALLEGKREYSAPGPLESDKVVFIPRGTDTPNIVSALKNAGVIDNYWWMQAILFIKGDRTKLRAGEYLFPKSVSLADVIAKLVSGRAILHSFTIPEGWSVEQIVNKLKAEPLLTSDVTMLPPEGTLMPDTYRFSRNESRQAQIAKMQAEDKKILAEIWATRAPNLPLKTPEQLVTLASIVEKETGQVDERPRVAAVFINRLADHIRLQSDPTVVYGIVGGKVALGHRLTKPELEASTAYNTYTNYGLPPGPIGNPGKAALEAVANPDHTKELYFVADGSGGHVFAETLKQHNINVKHWREFQKQNEPQGVIPQGGEPSNAPALTPPLASPLQPIPPPAKSDQHTLTQSLGQVYGQLPSSFSKSGQIRSNIGTALAQLATRMAAKLPASERNSSHQDATPKDASQLFADLLDGDDLAAAGIVIRGVNDEVPTMEVATLDSTAEDDMLPAADLSHFKPIKPDANDSAALLEISNQAKAGNFVAGTGKSLPKHVLAFDASEGTRFDPLKEQNYDLNSAQIVPRMAAR